MRAPGRVNLIGEHTDYNGGFVLPFAIDMDVRIALLPSDEPRIRITRDDNGETATISLDPFPPRVMPGTTTWPAPPGRWTTTASPSRGFDGVLFSTLPIGSGLSSSAALEVVTAWALSAPRGPAVGPLRGGPDRAVRGEQPRRREVWADGPVRLGLRCRRPRPALRLPLDRVARRAPAGRPGAGGHPQRRLARPCRQRVQRPSGRLRARRGRGGRR